MKKLVLAVSVAVLVLAGTFVSGCGNKIPAGAIATVGDGVVTKAQFDKLIQQAKAQAASQPSAAPFPAAGTPQYNSFAARVVEYLVQQQLIEQYAKQHDITVTDKEVQDRIKQIEQAYGGAAKVDAILKQQGMTRADLQDLMRSQILGTKVQQAILKTVNVTEAQMQQFWKLHKSEFQQPVTRTVRHILVKTKAEAEQVRALLVADPSNANWKKVAAKYSIDPGTKNNGGNLGPIRQGMMVPPFDKAAFSLQPGVISQPVHSQYGWHIIEVISINPGKTVTYAQAKARIQQTLMAEEQQVAWQNWLNKAEKDAHVRYAAGYNPAQLTASPTPATSPATQAASPSPTSTK